MVTQVHCICSTEAPGDAGAAGASCRHQQLANLHISICEGGTYRHPAGVCQGPEIKRWGRTGSEWTSGLGLSVDVSLCLDLQVGLRVWISPGLLWKHSFFPSASHCPIKAYGLQNGPLTSSKGTRPNSSSLEQSIPTDHHTYPWASGAFSGASSGSKLESTVVAALVLAFHRDEPVATLGIRPSDNAVHGKNCLVRQPKLCRSLLDHIPPHRQCW